MSGKKEYVAATRNEPEGLEELLQEMKFDLRQVTWGYQDIFYRIIRELYEADIIADKDNIVTQTFFSILKNVDKSIFDSVIKSYLEALRSSQRWMMRLPQLFEKWSNMGIALAEQKQFLGIKFFEGSARGDLGMKPADVEFVLSVIHTVREQAPELVASFIDGFPQLQAKLDHEHIRSFVNDCISIYQRNSESAKKYLALELSAAQKQVENMTRQVRVSEQQETLQRFLQGLLGREVTVSNLGELDSDDLIERGTVFAGCSVGFYLPEVIGEFKTFRENMRALKTLVTIGATCELTESFTSVHGRNGMETCKDVFLEGGHAEFMASLFYVTEVYRVLRIAHRRFPGIRRSLEKLLRLHFDNTPRRGPYDALLRVFLGRNDPSELSENLQNVYEVLKEIAENSSAWHETAASLKDRAQEITQYLSGGAGGAVSVETAQPVFFFPDPLFPMSITTQPHGEASADLHDAEEAPQENEQDSDNEDSEDSGEEQASEPTGKEDAAAEEEGAQQVKVGYFYDEWDNASADYYRQWCCLHEIRPEKKEDTPALSKDLQGYSEKVRRIFEQLKPEDIKEERRLQEGDEIHIDDFMEYFSEGPEKRGSEMRFYNKPFTNTRDVAVALLLDFSGSTGNEVQHAESSGQQSGTGGKGNRQRGSPEFGNGRGDSAAKTVLEIEKEAAFVLASGLHSLGDTFSIYGFTGTGRDNCLFHVIKEPEEAWTKDTVQQLLSVSPGSSTRIGVAMRHAGWKLEKVEAKTKLLLLITDGKPCDQGYDTANHYAQHDVRKAGQENMEKGIHTFCISTGENTPADMELMFPNGRHLMLDKISHLPQTLSHLYLRLTK